VLNRGIRLESYPAKWPMNGLAAEIAWRRGALPANWLYHPDRSGRI